MLDPIVRLADFLGPYWGVMIGIAVLALIIEAGETPRDMQRL